jgi:hypothetical protein
MSKQEPPQQKVSFRRESSNSYAKASEYLYSGEHSFGTNSTFNCYVFTPNNNSLSIRIEDSNTLESWSCNYPSEKIEQITQLSKSFKSFNVFVNMLVTALNQKTGSVKLEFWNRYQLEEVYGKNRRTSGASTGSNVNPAASNNRYLMLVYKAEFDL